MTQTLIESASVTTGMHRVVRAVYASRSRIDGPIYQQMESIRRSAMRHNLPSGIHTALLWQAGWFIQWREGAARPMQALMARIAGDWRHHGLCVVHVSEGPRLLDGPWSMSIVTDGESPEAMAGRVAQARAAMESRAQYSPTEVWRRLSMPAQQGDGDGDDPEAYQRVLLASAVGQVAFEMGRWLARRKGRALEHRRFAGLEMDVATESVDLRCGDWPMRIVAMSRKGLALPLTRALMRGHSHLVLLLCEQPDRNRLLLERVGQACAAMRRSPTVIGVGLDAGEHAALFAQARRERLVYLDARADPLDFEGCWATLRPLLRVWHEARQAGGALGLARCYDED